MERTVDYKVTTQGDFCGDGTVLFLTVGVVTLDVTQISQNNTPKTVNFLCVTLTNKNYGKNLKYMEKSHLLCWQKFSICCH